MCAGVGDAGGARETTGNAGAGGCERVIERASAVSIPFLGGTVETCGMEQLEGSCDRAAKHTRRFLKGRG